MTPIWAKPFTAPPPRARPILMGATGVLGAVGVDSGVAAEGLGGLLPQAASPARLRYTSGRKRAFRRMPGILLSDDEIRGGQYSGRRSEEHTSELQSQSNLVCRLLLEKKKNRRIEAHRTPNT